MIRAVLIGLVVLAACKGDRAHERTDDRAAPSVANKDERARIEALLAAIERSDVIFVRNGSDHGAREAAAHLRSKWGNAAITAEQFIDRYGTSSSTSGRAYRVRIGGAERDAGPWLHELLAAIP